MLWVGVPVDAQRPSSSGVMPSVVSRGVAVGHFSLVDKGILLRVTRRNCRWSRLVFDHEHALLRPWRTRCATSRTCARWTLLPRLWSWVLLVGRRIWRRRTCWRWRCTWSTCSRSRRSRRRRRGTPDTELVDAGVPCPVAGEGTPEVAERAVVEIGAALGVSYRSALCLVADAVELCFRLPTLVEPGAGGSVAGVEGAPGRAGDAATVCRGGGVRGPAGRDRWSPQPAPGQPVWPGHAGHEPLRPGDRRRPRGGGAGAP